LLKIVLPYNIRANTKKNDTKNQFAFREEDFLTGVSVFNGEIFFGVKAGFPLDTGFPFGGFLPDEDTLIFFIPA
jgi:hypothetical protein